MKRAARDVLHDRFYETRRKLVIELRSRGFSLAASEAAAKREYPVAIPTRMPAPAVIDLVLPWDVLVSDNLNKGVARREDRAKLARYQEGKAALKVEARRQYAGEPLICPLRVSTTFYPPDLRRRDMTNFLKGVYDALQGICYADDFQIADGDQHRKDPDRLNPRAVVTIVAAQ